MKIKFRPASKEFELLFSAPKPASRYIPEWFKHMPTHEPGHNGQNISRFQGTSSSRTAKGCTPLVDSLSSGYMFELAADVEFSYTPDGIWLPRYLVSQEIVMVQAPQQTEGMPRISSNTGLAYKWMSGWSIQTPKGYSTLFTHPLNRHDLPFRTFSGVVDTDNYKLPTHFPFQITDPGDKQSVVIQKGTPICQAIPFKREEWSSEVLQTNDEEYLKNKFAIASITDRSYKKQFWTKKKYS